MHRAPGRDASDGGEEDAGERSGSGLQSGTPSELTSLISRVTTRSNGRYN